jgi:hypothetical protein
MLTSVQTLLLRAPAGRGRVDPQLLHQRHDRLGAGIAEADRAALLPGIAQVEDATRGQFRTGEAPGWPCSSRRPAAARLGSSACLEQIAQICPRGEHQRLQQETRCRSVMAKS